MLQLKDQKLKEHLINQKRMVLQQTKLKLKDLLNN
jgi:hypothetical protein